MKKSSLPLYPLVLCCCWLMACSGSRQSLLLFHTRQTDTAAITRDDCYFAKQQQWLVLQTNAVPAAPGIRIRGNWNLSPYNRLVIEVRNLEKRGTLPLTVCLENKNASSSKRQGIFLDRLYVPPGTTRRFVLALPAAVPHPEVEARLTGMRMTPYTQGGLISAIDLQQVTGLSLYVNRPRNNWKWAVKYVRAEAGPVTALPSWMALTEAAFFPFIDRYGQFMHRDWPGKTHTDEDLVQSRLAEQQELNHYPGPPDRNRFGGWGKGPVYTATGAFRVEKINGKWWLIDPDGYLFWSHGVVRVSPSSGITPLDGRTFYFAGLPAANDSLSAFYETYDTLLKPYYTARGIQKTFDFSAANLYRKYGAAWRQQFAASAHQRLKSWGMNTIANSSDKAVYSQDKTPYTERIELKGPVIAGSAGAWWQFPDPFDTAFRAGFRRQLQERKAELDDPWCLGYFVDNEINWGDSTDLAVWTLQSPATQAAKIAMVAWLQRRYADISSLNQFWRSAYTSWDDLLQTRRKMPAGAAADGAAFSLVIAEAYFKNVRDELKAAAPQKLYLGCRFARSNEQVIRIAARYCDVLSYNIYSHTVDNFKLPEGIDKPVIIGEFHFGALDRGLFHPGLIKTDNQEARGKSYAAYVTSALRHPAVIGTHWHQFSDQATTGRFDGENFQVGLVDVCDRPYPETIRYIRETGYRLYEIRMQP